MKVVFDTTGVTWTEWGWNTETLTFTQLLLLAVVVCCVAHQGLEANAEMINLSITKIEHLLLVY